MQPLVPWGGQVSQEPPAHRTGGGRSACLSPWGRCLSSVLVPPHRVPTQPVCSNSRPSQHWEKLSVTNQNL